ncbi:hypothetical protein AB8Q18_04035 [Neisseriaceae bacterium CLB008]
MIPVRAIVRLSHFLQKLGFLSLTLLMMTMFVPSLMAGAMAHGPHLPAHEASMAAMTDCHEMAAPLADCCDDATTSNGSNPCAIACLSMAGTCMAPVLPMASLDLPITPPMVLPAWAGEEPFASISGVPDTPPPKA